MDSYTRHRQWVAQVRELTDTLADEFAAVHESRCRPSKRTPKTADRSLKWLQYAAGALIASVVALRSSAPGSLDVEPHRHILRNPSRRRGNRDRA